MVLFDVIDVLGGKKERKKRKGPHQCPELSTTSVLGCFFFVLFCVYSVI